MNFSLESGTTIVQRKKGIVIESIKIFSIDNQLLYFYSQDIINKIRKEKNMNKERFVVTEKGLYLIDKNFDWKDYVLINDPDDFIGKNDMNE